MIVYGMITEVSIENSLLQESFGIVLAFILSLAIGLRSRSSLTRSANQGCQLEEASFFPQENLALRHRCL